MKVLLEEVATGLFPVVLGEEEEDGNFVELWKER